MPIKIIVPETELFQEDTLEFIYVRKTTLVLEHSLVSISKWESKFHKPFLSKDRKTDSEIREYIKCMTITQNVDENVYMALSPMLLEKIVEYIDDPMTATKFYGSDSKKNNRQITSELIYYWMTAFNIPVEFQKWHLNRLLTLIRVCSIESAPPKKISYKEALARNKAENARRRRELNSKG